MDAQDNDADNTVRTPENGEPYLRAVLDNVLDGIVSINEDRIVETFNPAAERIFGYTAAEVIGRNVRMLMPEPYRSRHDTYVTNYLRTGKAKIIGIGREVQGRRKNGRIFPLDLAVSEMKVRGKRRFIGIMRDMKIIDQNRRGLEKIIEASANLMEAPSLQKFAQGVLIQLVSILQLDEHSALFMGSGFTASQIDCRDFIILAGTGKYEVCVGQAVQDAVSEDIMAYLSATMEERAIRFQDDMFAGHFATREGHRHLLYLKGCRNLTEVDKSLVRIFSSNVAAAFENIALNQEIIDTQKEVIFTLGEVIESRSRETGNHVRRVAQSSRMLALKAGLDEKEADLLQLVSPMHDVGKVGVPDAVLLKSDKLMPEEFEIMKEHTEIGYQILKSSNRDILAAAVYAARQHHERWDGKGYPLGLKAEEIHIFGRITAIADVFDALLHKRVYKPAWTAERVLAYFRKHRGRRFDPHLVDILLENSAEFLALSNKYPDPVPERQ